MKKKIIIGIVIIVAIIGLTVYAYAYLQSDWSWSLTAGEQTQIQISQKAFDCVGSNKPEVVFASISDKIEVVMQQQGSVWMSWVPDGPHNTLNYIQPDVTLYVSVYEDCDFVIERCGLL